MKMLSIVTPTYNRCKLLLDLFESIVPFSQKIEEWIIVDDGSTDETNLSIKRIAADSSLKIIYIHQTNQGKPSAVNKGIEIAGGKYITIIDSDDLITAGLVQMVDKFESDYGSLIESLELCGCAGLCTDASGNVIGRKFDGNDVISDHLTMRYKKNCFGDKNEVFVTSILKKYRYPVFKAEKFVPEALIWNRIGSSYKTVYYNTISCQKRYQHDGLTSLGDKLYLDNPLAATEYFKELFLSQVPLRLKLSASCMFYKYSNVVNRKVSRPFIFKPIYILGWMVSLLKRTL